jgi:hypothetical protein
MTIIKQPVCCARRTAKLTMDQAALARLAQMTAKRAEKGLEIETYKAKIDELKATIEEDKAAIVDHDADHAGGRL